MPLNRSRQFQHSRGYVRDALSQIWQVPPLSIPLNAAPSQAPTLEKGWGSVSFSHCADSLLVGWSNSKIGVDIEPTQRLIKASNLKERFFSLQEIKELKRFSPQDLTSEVLKYWVLKEAAIKWQGGRISSDISKWEISPASKLAVHHSMGYKIGIHQITYSKWHIGVALNREHTDFSPIICDHCLSTMTDKII